MTASACFGTAYHDGDCNVVLREEKTTQTVVDGGESGQHVGVVVLVVLPHVDLAILVGGDDCVVVVEGDGFGGVGGGLGVEGVESNASVVVVNVDFMDGGGV